MTSAVPPGTWHRVTARTVQGMARARSGQAPAWTVADYLTYWLREIVREDRRPKTYQGYEGVVRLHLTPGLGSKRLGKLTAQDVRTFITQARQECQCCKHGWDAQRDGPRCCALGQCCDSRLSARMVQSIHAVLRNALESAVREEIIPRNAAKLVQVPAPRYKVNRGLTAQQAKATLAAAAGHRLSALYVLALYLGLRRGKVLGLRWQDVDLEEAKLEVVCTLQRVGGALRLVPPKTEDSARTVPLPSVCVEALRAHQQRQAADRVAAWRDWEDHGLVFPSRRGTPMEPDNLRRSWGEIRRAAGLTARARPEARPEARGEPSQPPGQVGSRIAGQGPGGPGTAVVREGRGNCSASTRAALRCTSCGTVR